MKKFNPLAWALGCILTIAVMVLIGSQVQRANAISWVPIPCVTTSAGSPVSASGSFPCQPTFPGYISASPTPGPILFSPSSIQFASAVATPTTVAISESNFSGTFSTPSPTPAGIATISGFSSSGGTGTFTIGPSSNGTTTVYVSNIGGTGQSGALQVGVSSPAPSPSPSPGAISFTPSTVTFPNPTATATTVAISQIGWTGPWSVCIPLPGFVTSTISSSTLTIAPSGSSSGTNNLGICGSSIQANLSITVVPTAAPTPGAISLAPNPLNLVGIGTATPSPAPVTITEPNYSGPWVLAVPSPTGIISANIANNIITVAGLAPGSASVSVSCTNAANCPGVSPAPLTVNVSPTPGPISGPRSVNFSGPTAAPTTAAYTEANYSGNFALSVPSPTSIVSASISNSGGTGTVTVSPVGPGMASANVTDTNGQSFSVAFNVNPTPGPLTVSPNPIIFSGPTAAPQTITITDPYNTAAITAVPTPIGQASAGPVTTSNPGLSNFSASFVAAPIAYGTPLITVSDGTRSVNVPVTVPSAPGVTPGPIVATPAAITFAGQSGAPTPASVALTETNYSGTFNVADSNTNISTSSISGNTISITPVSGGTETVTVTNNSSPAPQSTTLSVTVNTPAPVYTNSAPGTAYPYAVTLPTPGQYTVLMQMSCPSNAAGASLLNYYGTTGDDLDIEAGLCNGATGATPGPGTPHVYQAAPTAGQSILSTQLTNNQQYIIAATNNGATLTYWYCTYPTITCSNAPTVVSGGNTTFTGTNGFIGGSSATTRVMPSGGYVWNVVIYPTTLLWPNSGVAGSMQNFASSYATANPYVSQPLAADSFANSIGTVVNYEEGGVYGYLSSPAPNGQTVYSTLHTLGVRHIRTFIEDASNANFCSEYNKDAAGGIGFDMLTNANGTDGPTQFTAVTNCLGTNTPKWEYVEGTNEVPIASSTDPNLNLIYTNQQTIYNARGTSIPTATKIIGASETTCNAYQYLGGYLSGGINNYTDYGVGHYYFSWRQPETTGWGSSGLCGISANYGSFQYNLGSTYLAYPTPKPVIVTETGYSDDCCGNSDVAPVTDTVMNQYSMRSVLQNITSGVVPLTYIYELGTDGQSYGLTDNLLNPKPAFYGIENLINIFSDPGTAITTTGLTYSLNSPPTDVQSALFQKRDGSYYLALWLNDSVFTGANTPTPSNPGTTIVVNPVNVTLSFPSAPSALIDYTINPSTGAGTSTTLTPAASQVISVTTTPQVLQIGTSTIPITLAPTPAPSSTPTATPTPVAAPLVVIPQPYGGLATAAPVPLASVLPLPSTGPFTVIVEVKCGSATYTPNPNGNAIWALGGTSAYGEAGLCNAPAANPTLAPTAAHTYVTNGTSEADAPNALTLGTSYVIAITDNGSTSGGSLNYYTCTYPLSTCTVGTKSVTVSATFTAGSTSYIGEADASATRQAKADIWNFQEYGYVPAAVSSSSPNSMATFLAALPTSTPYADPYPSPTSTATSGPTATPTASSAFSCSPSGTQLYQLPSACYTGNTPFHHTVAVMKGISGLITTQQAAGGSIASSLKSSLNGGVPNTGGNPGDLYFAVAGNASHSVTTTSYTIPLGEPGSSQISTIISPSNTVHETGSDHHIAVLDNVNNKGEYAGYSCSGIGACSAAQFFPFTGPGFSQNANGPNAPGFSWGILDISYQDLANFISNGTHIGHALNITVSEANTGSLFPSASRTCDTCGGASWPIYGSLIHLTVPPSNFMTQSSNPACYAVLYAFYDYGAYVSDVSAGNGSGFIVEYPSQYVTGTNPWTSTVNGISGSSLESNFNSAGGNCLGLAPTADIEDLQVNTSFSSSNPPFYGYGDPRN